MQGLDWSARLVAFDAPICGAVTVYLHRPGFCNHLDLLLVIKQIYMHDPSEQAIKKRKEIKIPTFGRRPNNLERTNNFLRK